MYLLRSKFIRLACGLLLIILPACVTTTADYDAVRNDINQLKKETFELRKDSLGMRTDLDTAKSAASGAVKEDTFNAIRESQTAMYSQVMEISKELQMLRGRFDENKFHIDKALKENNSERELFRSQINSIENKLREINNSMEARLKELNEKVVKLSSIQQAAPPAAQRPLAGEAQESIEKPPKELPVKDEPMKTEEKNGADDPVKVYEAAYNLYKEKRYGEAREKFISFIRKYPKEKLADRAQFWVAETLYSEKDYEGSILAYETLIKAYPKSEKAPEALFKQGMAFIELGDKKTAKILFEKLVDKYPESRDVPAAKKKLSEMNAVIRKKK